MSSLAINIQDNPCPVHSYKFFLKKSYPYIQWPSCIMGTAAVFCGEVGFLIAALAEPSGVFRCYGEEDVRSSKLYLILTWAIVLCTIAGPLYC